MFKLIAAIGENNELGLNGDLVFRIKDDMKFFRETTTGHSVFMGYKTFLSLPGGALPDRKNYVLTHHPDDLPDGVTPVTDLDKFISEKRDSNEVIFVIGGASVYESMLPFCDVLYLTEVESTANADVFFPKFDKIKYNKQVIKRGSCNDLTYSFTEYTKIN